MSHKARTVFSAAISVLPILFIGTALFSDKASAQTVPLAQQNRGVLGTGSAYTYEHGWTYSISGQQMQQELELVDEQVEKISRIRSDFSKQQQQLYKDLYKGGPPDALDREILYERIAGLRDKLAEDIAKVLLPHQVKRAKEVWLRSQVSRGGAYAFRNANIRELLGITPEQYERLTKRSSELNAELAKKYQELRAEAVEELLRELTPEQRKKLEELSGDKYVPAPIDYRKQYEQRRAAQQKQEQASPAGK